MKHKIGMHDNEVVAVLGHELGHWAHWHSTIQLALAEVIFIKCETSFLLIKDRER